SFHSCHVTGSPPPSVPTRRSSDLIDSADRCDHRRRGEMGRNVEETCAAILVLASLAAPVPAGAGGTPNPGTATSSGSTLPDQLIDPKSTRLNSSHVKISYAGSCSK